MESLTDIKVFGVSLLLANLSAMGCGTGKVFGMGGRSLSAGGAFDLFLLKKDFFLLAVASER